MRREHLIKEKVQRAICALLLSLQPVVLSAQGTRIVAPQNRYSPADDVKLGRQAAAEVKQKLPVFPEGSEVDSYVERVGRRIVAAIPREFQHPGFAYEFDVVNAGDINAFALPGGPVFVNRGMIEAANNEGEMAGVMAHEISHVALRHGTAQATKAQKFQLPAIGGAILGAIIGGNVGSIISQGTQLGLGAYLLKYSREYESQADTLGAQIMARAGYDPRDLANMFRTIQEKSGGRGGPQWLSSHPDPGNRYQRIIDEARRLGIDRSQSRGDSAEFNRIQNNLRRMSPAPTMEEILRGKQQPVTGNSPTYRRPEQRVELPSGRYRAYTAGNLFRINVPTNWEEFPTQNSVTFAPRGAYGNYEGQNIFTHGTVAGVANVPASNLEQASDQFISALLRNNSYLRPQGNYRRGNIDGRDALTLTLTGRSPITGQNEIVSVYTTLLRNGGLFYLINVAPRDEYRAYERAFSDVLRSTVLNG